MLPRLDARLDDPVLLELAHELSRDGRAVAELGEVDLALASGEPDVPPARAIRGHRALERLADDAQRQELVALEAQDRRQALHVVG